MLPGEQDNTTAALYPLVSDSVSLTIVSTRSRCSTLPWRALQRNPVSAIGESFDGLVTAAAECDAAEYLMYTGGTNGTGDPDRVAHLHVSVTIGGDVERVDGVSPVFKQRTEFRFTALKEDLENRTVIHERGKVEQTRKIGEEVKIHVPANTRTLVRKPLPTETSSHRASMRNSVQLSIDANTELDALVSRTGEPISKSAGLSASGTSSLLKRKNSLPDADAALVATAASVKSGTNGHHTEKYRAGIASFFGKFLAVELKQPISGDPEDDGAHANCAPATKAPSLAYFRTTSMAAPPATHAQRTLALAIDMPLQPKDWATETPKCVCRRSCVHTLRTCGWHTAFAATGSGPCAATDMSK